LELGQLDEAAVAAQRGAASLIGRGDSAAMMRWIDALGPDRVTTSAALLAMQVRGLRGARRFTGVSGLARQLEETGRLAEVVKADPGVVAHLGWAMQWQPFEAMRLLDRYGDYRATGVRYFLGAVSEDDPVLPPRGAPRGEVDRLVSWGLMIQGRLDELIKML